MSFVSLFFCKSFYVIDVKKLYLFIIIFNHTNVFNIYQKDINTGNFTQLCK